MPIQNGVMMQFFHWYSPGDGTLWDEAAARAPELAAAGFTGVWLPPAYKGIGGASDVGYGVYDMYDLGEFDQKGSVRTKYGTKKQYLSAVKALQQGRPAGLRRHRAQPPHGRRRHRGGAGHSVSPGRPASPEGRGPRDRGLHALQLPGPQGEVLGVRVARAPLRRGRLRPPQPRREAHGLPDRRQAVRRPGGARERQLLLPDGGRPRLREPGGARRGRRLGQVVPRHDRRRRLPARRGEAHLGLVLPGVARRDGAPREEGPVHRGGVLDPGHRRAALVPRPPGRAHHALRRAAPLPLPLREPRLGQLRHAPAARRHADAAARPRGGHLRREPRLAAAAGARVGGRALVQAARLRADPAAARGLPVRVPRRLLRRRVRGLRPGRQPPPHRDAVAPLPDRQVPGRAQALRLGPAGRLPRPLEPRRLGAARRRAAPEGDGGADERRPGRLEVDGGRARRTPASATRPST